MKNWLLLTGLLLTFLQDAAAQSDKVVVQDIILEGNKKTKRGTVLRELDFLVGDTLALGNMMQRLQNNEKRLLSSGLFTDAKINIRDWEASNNHVTVLIKLRETHFTYPLPIFELADRNFNVWWYQQNHAWNRLNYGVRFVHSNLTGNRDALKLTTQFGYTQRYELVYNFPNLNKAKTIGLSAFSFYSLNHEVSYGILDNAPRFLRDEDNYLLKRFRLGATLAYRPKLKTQHRFRINYSDNITKDTINELNEDFFMGKTRQQFATLGYQFEWNNLDILAYPTSGKYVTVDIEKTGIGSGSDVNLWSIYGGYSHFFNFGKKERWIADFALRGKLSILRNQPAFYNYSGLGYSGGTTLRGYELYVINGMDWGLAKTTLRYKLLDKAFDWGKKMPVKGFKYMPVQVYLKTYTDVGYSNSPYYIQANDLANQWLYGFGVGADVVLYVDKIFRLEYSINHLSEKRIYLHYTFNL